MKVVNKTSWRTDQLKAILQRCAEQEFDDGKRRKNLVVTVEYTRNGGCSGFAWYHSNHSVVRIANPTKAVTWVPTTKEYAEASIEFRTVVNDDVTTYLVPRREGGSPNGSSLLKLEFAHVACHEFAHNRGMKHGQMPGYYRWSGNWKPYVAWAADMPLDVKPVKVKAKPSVDTKLAHVMKMRTLAETRSKRAATILRKWKTKERYYERRAAAHRKETA